MKACTASTDPDVVIKGCSELIARGTRTPTTIKALAHIMRGTFERDRGQDDAAIADMTEALRLQPTFEPSLVVRGDSYRHKGDYDTAFADYNKALQINPKYDEALAERGEVYRHRKDWDHALADYTEAIRINPKHVSYYNNRAGIRESLNDLDGAIADLTTSIGVQPNLYAYKQRARLYDVTHDFPRSLADCDATLRLDPKDASIYVTRSDIDAKRGDFDAAIADGERAIQADPKSPYAHDNKGDGFRGKGLWHEALAEYDKALALSPDLKDVAASRDQMRQAIAENRPPPPVASAAKADTPVDPVTAGAEHTGRRIALVVGNSDYAALPKLDNPKHDAEDLAAALTALGFETTLAVNASRDAMEDRFAAFAKASRDSQVALIFFAGHGLQFGGTNYIVPVDAHVDDETDLRHLIPVQSIIDDLDNAPNVRLLILDACRETGVIQKLAASLPAKRGVSIKRGLIRDEAAGTLIAYSTQSGSVADDGTGGRNSPFARALLKHLPDSGIDVRVLFTRVRGEVFKATGGEQNPEVSDSLVGEFSFK